MRKLTVKNFSVIKDAELEFGKITVLIGPQSSGKSLLCKLAYFFQKIVPEQLENAMRVGDPWLGVAFRVERQFSDWFDNYENAAGILEIQYADGDYAIRVGQGFDAQLNGSKIGISFSDSIKAGYESVLKEFDQEMQLSGTFADYRPYTRAIHDVLIKLSESGTGEVYSYIPSTRAFFVSQRKAIQGVANRNDEITLRFSQDLDFDFDRRIPSSGREHKLARWVDDASLQILQGKIVVEDKAESFRARDGRLLPFSLLSSGTQELLPLITCLREFVAASAAVAVLIGFETVFHPRLLFVEEPEANIFPRTQYDLVRVFARVASEAVLDASFVITTHSPYVLSAFNNLLEAWHVGHTDGERADAVRKIIDESYWVNPEEFRAYAIEEGILKSIIVDDTKLISENYLDSVSETIGAEFDELLRIGYAEA